MSEESKSWYTMSRPLFNSGVENDEFWLFGQDGFQEVLDSFLGSDVLIYDKAIYVKPRQVRAVIQNETSDTFSGTTLRQILCNIGVLKCGQYVNHDGAIWLVSSLPDNNRIYEKAILWKCQDVIRFISPLSGDIVEYPVYSTNSTQYGTGADNGSQITVGADQHLIYLPYNEETILIDNDFRFLMDKNHENPSAYSVTRVDPISYAVGAEKGADGLIQWSVLQTQLNEATDNKELMVADYYAEAAGSSKSTEGTDGTLTLTDLDGDYMLSLGETKQIQVSYILSDGTEESELDYELTYDLADGAASVVSVDENIITLQATRDRAFVGESVTITATSEDLGCESTITIQIVNW